LRGHDDEITCAALSVDLDICVSGSKDATVVIHTLQHGKYIRSIKHPNRCTIHKLALSSLGHIVIYSSGDNFLFVFGINGEMLTSVSASDSLCNLQITGDGELIVTGGRQITIRRIFDLAIINTYTLTVPTRIVDFAMSKDEQHIYTVSENSRILVLAGDSLKQEDRQ